MRRTKWTVGVFGGAIVGGLVMAGPVSRAADWPQWRGAARDGTADFTAPATWPKEVAAKWKTAVGLGDGTPALVGDKLYVFARPANDEVTYCLDAATGKILWQDKYPATVTVTGMAAPHQGPRSSPAVADGKVVTLDEGATVSCLDAANGKVVWRKDFSKEGMGWPRFYTATSPLIVDGLCIVQLGAQGKGAIFAIDMGSGEVKWKWEGDGAAYGSPTIMTLDGAKQIVALTEKSVIGINAADGKLAWQSAFGGGGMGMGRGGGGMRGGPGGGGPGGGGPGNAPGGGGPRGITPNSPFGPTIPEQVGPGGGGPGGGGPGAGGPANGGGGRRGGGPGGGRGMGGRGGGMSYNAASPVVDGSTVIVTSPGAGTKAMKIEKSDTGYAAKDLWTNKETSAQFSTPVLKDGKLYGISGNGNFFCIDASTGATLWASPDRYGERGFGTVVYAGSVLLSLTSGSDLVVFTPGDKAYAEVAKLKLSSVPSYSYPVAAGNRIYIKDRDSVMMYTLE